MKNSDTQIIKVTSCFNCTFCSNTEALDCDIYFCSHPNISQKYNHIYTDYCDYDMENTGNLFRILDKCPLRKKSLLIELSNEN